VDTTNPLHDGLRIAQTPGPTTLVIFGATGDLTRRKLLPAVYHLSRGQRLPARFAVLGIGRTKQDDEAFRQQFVESLREFASTDASTDEVATSLVRRLHYLSGNTDDPGLYAQIAEKLRGIDGGEGVLYYLAIPPNAYGPVIERRGAPAGAGSSSRSPSAPTSPAHGLSTRSSTATSTRSRSSASITTSARRRCRT
jgi:glucose-6-phosphate 1-dehydrogenase